MIAWATIPCLSIHAIMMSCHVMEFLPISLLPTLQALHTPNPIRPITDTPSTIAHS